MVAPSFVPVDVPGEVKDAYLASVAAASAADSGPVAAHGRRTGLA